MKEYVRYAPRLRSLFLLMVVGILAIDAKYFLLASNSINYMDDLDNRMLNSIGVNMIQTLMKERKPVLILHVGPRTTAAQSIEATFSKENSEELLHSNNYTYITSDLMKRSRSYHCNANITTGCVRSLSSDLLELLERQDQNLIGSNVLLSDLDDEKRRAWIDATANNQRDVNVVVDYVRLYELLPSRYNEFFEKRKNDHNWPGIQGSNKVPSFSEYLANTADLKDHESVRTYEGWAKDFSVSIFNVHQEGDVGSNFVCQEIKGANNLCQKLTQGPHLRKRKVRNSGSPMVLDYDILAVHAYEQGLVHESDNRSELAKAIQDHHKRSKQDLPRACPDKETLDKVYNASKEFESWALETGASKPATDLDASWNIVLKDNKLCGVDPAAAIEQGFWKNFFRLRYVQKSSQQFYVG